MALEDRRLDEITKRDLQELVENGVPESRTLDFKRDLPGPSDGTKKEFLKDVSAMANTLGGHLVYGMDEDGKEGTASDLCGCEIEGPDDLRLRLNSIIRDGLEPGLYGLEILAVPLANGRYAVIVRVPRSWNGPHMVVFKKERKFYGRSSVDSYPLDTGELRILFGAGREIEDRFARFRDERAFRILQGRVGTNLSDNPRIALHLASAAILAQSEIYDLTYLRRRGTTREARAAFTAKFAPIVSNNTRNICPTVVYSVDGAIAHVQRHSEDLPAETAAYTQAFRTGHLEGVNAEIIQERHVEGHDVICMQGDGLDEIIVEWLRRLLAIANDDFAQAYPFFFTLTLIGVGSGVPVWREAGFPMLSESCALDEIVPLPVVAIRSQEEPLETVVKPILDTLWHIAGYPQALGYDSNGNWVGGPY